MRYVTITPDPTGTFTGIKHNKLLAACGLLPYFVQEAALSGPLDATDTMEVLKECYGFPAAEMSGGKVTKDGTYQYPDEPDMAPMVSFKIDATDTEVLVYQLAIVAVRDSETTLITRMD
jgi:hypothetical protein